MNLCIHHAVVSVSANGVSGCSTFWLELCEVSFWDHKQTSMIQDPLLHAHLLIFNEGDTIESVTNDWVEKFGLMYLVAAIFYLPLIFTLQYLWKNKSPMDVKSIRLVHNILFTIFSAIGAIELTPVMINTWIDADFNFKGTVCSGFYMTSTSSLWVYLFVLSKFFELFESFFFILEKKPLPFIHWYHHFMTYVFSCQALYFRGPGIIYYSWMNLWVHAFMYFYYVLTSTGRKPSWAILITISQLVQMFVGVAVTYIEIDCGSKLP